MGALFSGGQRARRDSEPPSQSSVTEEHRRQVSARKQPSGLPIFAAAAALLVSRISIKDILLPRALQHRQISGNAPVPHFVIGSYSRRDRDVKVILRLRRRRDVVGVVIGGRGAGGRSGIHLGLVRGAAGIFITSAACCQTRQSENNHKFFHTFLSFEACSNRLPGF